MIAQQMVDSVCLQIQNLIIERNDALEQIQQQNGKIKFLEEANLELFNKAMQYIHERDEWEHRAGTYMDERDALKADAERYQRVRRMASCGELPREWTEGYTERELDATLDEAKGE